MILSRTPLRVSFVGGGTDIPSFYRNHGGAVVTSAVTLNVEVLVKRLPPSSGYRYQFNDGAISLAGSIDSIEHDLTREAVRLVGYEDPIEIISRSSVPAGIGLGSSSSYAVGLLNSLHALKGEQVTVAQLAEEACRLEIEILKHPIGKQDQYIASLGGLRHLVFHEDGNVTANPVDCDPKVYEDFQRHLLLFYLGGFRQANSILSEINGNIKMREKDLQEMKSLCHDFVEILASGTRLRFLGEILDTAWRLKRKLSQAISNELIDRVYERSRVCGAIGGKLLGAGGTGILLLFVPPDRHEEVRHELREFKELQYRCDLCGSRIVS